MARPSDFEQRRRAREFWRVLTETGDLEVARDAALIDSRQVLRMLSSREALDAALELVRQRAS